jgi:trehalose-6-phosphate synthase
MPAQERRDRMTRMRERVSRFNIYRWARDFIGWTARTSGGRTPAEGEARAPAAVG